MPAFGHRFAQRRPRVAADFPIDFDDRFRRLGSTQVFDGARAMIDFAVTIASSRVTSKTYRMCSG
jgi:hypothetical protein